MQNLRPIKMLEILKPVKMLEIQIKPNKEEEFVSQFCLPLALGSPFAQGLRDDVAFLKSNKKILVKTDSFVQGVHLKMEVPPFKMGHKLMARALSDVLCKGGMPIGFVLAFFKPANLEKKFMIEFLEGMKSFKVPLIGGDLTSSLSENISANLTIFAEKTGAIPARNKAKTGDFIYVTGKIGRAFLGFQGLKEFLPFYETPTPNSPLLTKLFAKYKINASIDISDGFLKDLSTLLHASKKGAEIELHKIPTPDYPEYLSEMLTFGDDYEVIFTSKEEILEEGVAKIGVVKTGNTLKIKDGETLNLKELGFSYF